MYKNKNSKIYSIIINWRNILKILHDHVQQQQQQQYKKAQVNETRYFHNYNTFCYNTISNSRYRKTYDF